MVGVGLSFLDIRLCDTAVRMPKRPETAGLRQSNCEGFNWDSQSPLMMVDRGEDVGLPARVRA